MSKNYCISALKPLNYYIFSNGLLNIIKLDENYQYSLVVSSGFDYLWLLARKKTIPEDIKQQYLDRAKELGFDTSKLIWVKQ